MQELNGFNIPSWSPTVDGTCANDPASVSQASDRGWWSCGHYTRDTDITACPTQFDWGVSFDDGPSVWSACSRYLTRDICVLIDSAYSSVSVLFFARGFLASELSAFGRAGNF